jgi:hypothetical protein
LREDDDEDRWKEVKNEKQKKKNVGENARIPVRGKASIKSPRFRV